MVSLLGVQLVEISQSTEHGAEKKALNRGHFVNNFYAQGSKQ